MARPTWRWTTAAGLVNRAPEDSRPLSRCLILPVSCFLAFSVSAGGGGAEGARELIELLERIGVDFHLAEVRGALEDILRLGSANIPDLWLSDEEMLEKGLVEG